MKSFQTLSKCRLILQMKFKKRQEVKKHEMPFCAK